MTSPPTPPGSTSAATSTRTSRRAYPVSATESATSNATVTSEAPFVNYAEGIYLGYRYYETAAVEGFIDYDQAVVYPFGYGLSYTDFAWEIAGSQARRR
ncbi:hypothetical protein [Demequina litorisediminis]|uniref:hypothetical protein n=1 Tax=Demequina litorisediminis TaxID=1849022 RepID=UPI0024E0FB51|nr:hypothetical protein [Demequina litorisediminis]